MTRCQTGITSCPAKNEFRWGWEGCYLKLPGSSLRYPAEASGFRQCPEEIDEYFDRAPRLSAFLSRLRSSLNGLSETTS
jgi:hypothetical protein